MALFKRKDKDTKKGAESAIGKIIYGFLLFMPLLSIGARCLYVIFNKNAYQSYSAYDNTPLYETNEVNNVNDLVVGNIYNFTIQSNYTNTNITYFNASAIYNLSNTYYDLQIEQLQGSTLNLEETANRYQFYTNVGYIQLTDYNGKNQINGQTFQFVYKSSFNADYINQVSIATYIPITQSTTGGTLDNVFEYSINKVENSNLYKWASETGTYTVLNTTCNQLGITNTFIPLLFAYWLLTSVIYFIFDIALILIWMIHNKIHELQESI